MIKNIDSVRKVYFVGIGGVSMSSLAMILAEKGVEVCGYDVKHSDVTAMLEKNGIHIDYDFNRESLDKVDTMVYSAAIKSDDPYLAFARENNIAILTRAELLGIIACAYPHAIGVSGTHGKSTTTGMLAEICLLEDSETAVLSGAVLPKIGGLYKTGRGERIVFEACEYKNSYHAMQPTIKVVLNCEHDHVDFFPRLEDVQESFHKYIDMKRCENAENIAIVNLDCKNALKASENTSAKVYYFSLTQKTHFYAENIDVSDGYGCFDLVLPDSTKIEHIKLAVPGMHNVDDALAAAAAAYITGVSPENIKKGLEGFMGASRRFEKLGEYNGALFADDYAHHPDEIRATLSAVKNLPFKRVICVFQPHTYTRTYALLDEFAKALSLADEVIIADIYAAREKNTVNVSSADIVSRMENAKYIADFEVIAEELANSVGMGDLVITMGAGEAYKVAEYLGVKR